MNQIILEMFSQSTYRIFRQKYRYVKVGKMPEPSKHFLVTRDEDEMTVVTQEKNLPELKIIEKNPNTWRLVSLNLATPFMAGTLATVNSACAEKGLNNLIVSTYSKDYIIIKDSQVRQIKEVLQSLGFQKKRS